MAIYSHARAPQVGGFEDILQTMVAGNEVQDTGEAMRAAGLSTGYAQKVIESLQEGSMLGTSAIRSQLRAERGRRVDVDIPSLIEPLDDYFADNDNFRLLWARRWKHVEEHINLKECRVAVSSLKRSCRVRELQGHRKLTVSDNLSTVAALSKGRSSSFQMNKLCRVSAAYQLACGIIWHIRHIETKRNVADEPSRNYDIGRRLREPPVEAVNLDICSGPSDRPSHPSKQTTFGDAARRAVPVGKSKFFLEVFADWQTDQCFP